MEAGMDARARMIEATTALIERGEGDVKRITSRMIAEAAGVGLGLINYHFGSKENLIAACVQRIISGVVADFRMDAAFATDRERLCAWAERVFEFLFAHAAISRISILDDLQNCARDSNSDRTRRGFAHALRGEMAEADRAMLTFVLVAAMQAAFLGGDAFMETLGYDFTRAEERARYIRRLVDMLFEGTVGADGAQNRNL